MKELEAIISAFDKADALGKKTALATVVHVDGSSYRRAGARMLITEDGQLTGAISGGCLEGDALRKARLVIVQQQPMLVTYDTTDDDDAKLGVGLGCNGIINILIEPIMPEQALNPMAFFRLFLSKREPVVLVTVFNMTDKRAPQYGTCLLINEAGHTLGSPPDHGMSDLILSDAFDVLHNGNTATKTYVYQNSYTCFIELLQPALSLVVVGAGNDAIPLTQMAKVLGWRTTVVDGRANYITAERFPQADQLIAAKPNEVTGRLNLDKRTVFMLMTHNYNYDMALLEHLLPEQLPFVGVLGPKKRLTRMLEELNAVRVIPQEQLQHVYGPAGLDLGSENPEEIALSILAQIQSVINNRDGSPLYNKQVIHDRDN
ncbi:XdhC family protein [Mucilaginibacter sp. KACC 22773]|uniref:XdhC family protein n=1 Tax=Mucilaginibacter sp. KACC 22773 TaxID=3025671 RepID=UPI0023650FFD|nr:XdhC/CoxI family protein [Mucilaginibacter sp. KACC 22773]WDF77212.1 XdhC family protein [Mucilaginibacter sp. KACC 22773]